MQGAAGEAAAFAPYTVAAAAQLAVAAIVTAFTAPMITAFPDKRMRARKLGVCSGEAAAEREKERQAKG